MSEQRNQHITLRLDAHTLSINVPADNEHLYRKAANVLNEKYRSYQRRLQTTSAEQLWVYVALDVAVNLCADAHANRLQPIDEKIKELNNKIIKQLNKE